MDGDALKKELARVRDGEADLLQRLTPDAPAVVENSPTAVVAPRRSRARSGGMVDAPGKKHRPPMPTDPVANRANNQAKKMRAAKTIVKTPRRRGRGPNFAASATHHPTEVRLAQSDSTAPLRPIDWSLGEVSTELDQSQFVLLKLCIDSAINRRSATTAERVGTSSHRSSLQTAARRQ